MSNTLFADILQQELDLRIKVTGRSMRPFINSGEIVTLRKISSESLKRGDIVYYTSTCGSPLMHRIVSITKLHDNNLSFTTKGDALLQNDKPILTEQILGKALFVEKSLPLFGTFSVNVNSILSTILHRIYTQLFSIKCKTRHYLQLVCNSFVNK